MSTLTPPPAIVTTLAAAQGLAGPPGPVGPAGPAAGAGADYVAAVAVGGHRVLAVDAAGQAVYASCDTLSDALRVAGVSLGAAEQGDTVTVQAAGLVQHAGWAWTPDQPVFLGLDGVLVQSLPVGAVFSLVVGWAVAPDRVLVRLQPPIVIA